MIFRKVYVFMYICIFYKMYILQNNLCTHYVPIETSECDVSDASIEVRVYDSKHFINNSCP